MKFLTFVLITILLSPFLVCDPYPVSDPQPDRFIIQSSGVPDVIVPVTKNTDNSVIIHYDVAPFLGQRVSWTVCAENDLFGRACVPFGKKLGVGGPGGLAISK